MKKSNKKAWLWLIILLAIFVTINYFAISLKPKAYPRYVSDSPSLTGTKAIYTYFNNEMNGNRWNASPDILPMEKHNTSLIMIEPSIIPDEKEMEAYLDFVRAGNTIVLLRNNPKGMFDFNTEPKDIAEDKTLKVYDQNNKVYRAENSSTVRLEKRAGDKILLRDKYGTIALKREEGKGELIVGLTPQWMTNDLLLKKDHLPLVLGLLGETHAKTFLFDEYLHGNKSAADQLMVYPKWFLVMILQGIFLMVLWLWYRGKRFGPIFVPREETVRFSDEGIRALSAWYLRGARYHDSIVIQAEYIKSLLQERWGVPHSRNWLDLTELFERKLRNMPTSDIRPFLTGIVQILEKEKLSKQEYLLWSRKLDRLRNEVEQG